MPRRSISALQSKLLKILEEAGEENIPTVINTLYPRRKEPDGEEILVFERSLIDLWKKEFVLIQKEITNPQALPQTIPISDTSEVFPLSHMLEWSAEESIWTNKEKQDFLITLTDMGINHLKQ